MKSYKDHLESLVSKSPSSHCNRASSIFPVFSDSNISMELLFLNYWRLKRNIDHLLCRYYLRDWKGNLIFKKCFYVDDVKAYSLKLSEILGRRVPFSGSLEVEFCSPENLVFPYPGVVVYYRGKHFSTCVHSAQRTFNDEQDQKTNGRAHAIESGFNIYANETSFPFLTYINGKKPLSKQVIELAAYNKDQKVIGAQLKLDCAPYGTTYLSLEHWKELKPHLKGEAGCIKAKLSDPSIFPRLIVGNKNTANQSIAVTHTYYDLIQSQKEKDYWKTPNSNWHPAALSLPLKKLSKYKTRVYFYPIYSPSKFWIDLEIFNLEGNKVKEIKKVYEQKDTPRFSYLDADSFSKNLDSDQSYTFRMIAQSPEGTSIPARIKIGYDVGYKSGGFPCNICTNFYPANPSLENKKAAFRWAPFMPQHLSGSIWCLNDAPKKEYKKTAKIKLTFFRYQDTKKIEESKKIPAHGALELISTKKLSDFFQGEPGWCTFESDNPYITTYYFSEHPSGMIGGDHGF